VIGLEEPFRFTGLLYFGSSFLNPYTFSILVLGAFYKFTFPLFLLTETLFFLASEIGSLYGLSIWSSYLSGEFSSNYLLNIEYWFWLADVFIDFIAVLKGSPGSI